MSSGTKAKSNYMLILFLDNGSNNYIDIVPHSWLSINNDATYCKYMPPPYNATTSRILQGMVKKNEDPLPTWSEYLVEIRGRARTYKDAEKRLLLLEKQSYVFTTDNEESAKLQGIKEKKSLKIKSVGDLSNLKMTLDKSTINFDKDLHPSVSPQQIISSSSTHAQPCKKLMNVSSSSISSFHSDENLQIQKKKKQTKMNKIRKNVKHRLSIENNDSNSLNDLHNKNINNGVDDNIKRKKIKFESTNEDEHEILSDNEVLLMVDDDKNLELKNDTYKIDQAQYNMIVRYFRSISKQIANLNGQVVLNTASIELLTNEIKKNKKCSCMNESNENLDISTDNDNLYESEFSFPLENEEIFGNFDNEIKDDSKYHSFIEQKLRKMISPKHTVVKNMGDILRGFLTRDVALRFVPLKLSSKDITKKIFKDSSFYSSIQDVFSKKLSSSPENPLGHKEILKAMATVLQGARDWDGHRLLRIKKL